MNTGISYLYRDASNYKEQNYAVVEGEITQDQIDTIMDCLSDRADDYGYFIPFQVGLDEERPGAFDEEDDHVWFELYEDSFEIVDRPVTTWPQMTVEELVENFEAARDNWDEMEAWERLIS